MQPIVNTCPETTLSLFPCQTDSPAPSADHPMSSGPRPRLAIPTNVHTIILTLSLLRQGCRMLTQSTVLTASLGVCCWFSNQLSENTNRDGLVFFPPLPFFPTPSPRLPIHPRSPRACLHWHQYSTMALLAMPTAFVQPATCSDIFSTKFLTTTITRTYHGTGDSSTLGLTVYKVRVLVSDPADPQFTTCQPPGWPANVASESRFDFSPAVCPSGWTAYGLRATDATSHGYCCARYGSPVARLPLGTRVIG